MTNQRPAGITILAMIHLIGGVFTVGLSVIFLGGAVNPDAAARAGTEVSTGELLAASVAIFISAYLHNFGLLATFGDASRESYRQ